MRIALLLCCLGAACALACSKEREVAAGRPNVVVLITDDQAVGTMGFEGHPFSRTPHLDRLAAEGATFANAFVTTPLCSPSRASFLTGLYARSHGVRVNRAPFPRDLPTFASLLTAAGYDSAYVGKWHMGEEAGPRPGFGYTASFVGQGKYNGNYFLVGGPEGVQEIPDPRWVDEASTEYALEFLRREREAPFLLVVGFKAPHRPQLPAEADRRLYPEALPVEPPNADARPPFPFSHEFNQLAAAAGVAPKDFSLPEGWRAPEGPRPGPGWPGRKGTEVERERDYYRVIHGIDRCVGRLLDTLDELGVADDTVVVFVSDNGLSLGSHGMVGKRTAYEESLRVPLLVRYPALVPAGSSIEPMVLGVDLAPTILALAGEEVPESMQGRDLAPLLVGHADEPVPWRESGVFEFFLDDLEHVPSFLPTNVSLRTSRWKLIEYPGYPQWTELFDLEEDPGEERNLATTEAGALRVESLREELARLESALGPR
jgi:arylsulfatase A-like enzyme